MQLVNSMALISYHTPIFFITDDNFEAIRRRSFEFENKWLRDEGIRELVGMGWKGHDSRYLGDKLSSCLDHLAV